MTTESPLHGSMLPAVRRPFDRRFYKVLAASALGVGAVTAGLLHAARRPDPALASAASEDRQATLRAFVQRQQEREREGGTGTRHVERAARYAIRSHQESPHLSRLAAREQVANRGVFSALGAPGGGEASIVSPFGETLMAGTEVGDATGAGGLGAIGHGAGSGSGQGYGAGAGRGFAAPVTAAPVIAIDPNGRFATTYRPGHGHRAWFDAAVARGEIPEATRDLLAELGAQGDAAMAAPEGHALDLQVDLERAALAPAGGDFRMRLALRSAAATGLARPVMSVHLVLDVSGSMSGAPMANALAAAHALVDRLANNDHFSLTTFASDARVVVYEGLVGPRRAAIGRVIDGLEIAGGTNLSEGLADGYRMASLGPSAADANRLVLLLSDGEPTDGETDRAALAAMATRALQEGGIETTSVGVGTSYDGALMSAIADQGAGGYYYVPDSARIADALRAELDDRAQPVAQAVEVRVRLADGIALTEAYGSRRLDAREAVAVRAQEVALDARTASRDRIARDRDRDRAGGMRFFIPGFARDDRHVMLFGLRAPAGSAERPVATIELRYKDRVTGRNVTVERPVRVGYAPSDAASAATASVSVQRTAQSFEAGRTLAEASAAAAAGDRDRAAALLTERESLLRAASSRLEAPALTDEANRLARVRSLLGGGGPSPMVLAMLLETSSRGMMR